MKKRSNAEVMARLIVLVKPLTGFMILAILMGLIGHLCAAFITILGSYAVLGVAGIDTPFSLAAVFVCVLIFALLRGILRYGEQSCNHYIAFKLLAIIRDYVFKALRRLCPAKLEGKDKGNLISVITSDIELLEVFYAHTISPIVIAVLFSAVLCIFIGSYHPLLGVLALAAYIIVGLVIPVITSGISGEDGMALRVKSGKLSSFLLDSLYGLSETLQYGEGENRLREMNEQTEELSVYEKKLKKSAGYNGAVTNTVILLSDIIMLFTSASLYQNGMVEFDGVIIPVIALMSSFGPVIALANLGSTLSNTFAAGNRVLDILDETPIVDEVNGKEKIAFTGAKILNVNFSYENFKPQNSCAEPKDASNSAGEEILSNVSLDIAKNHIIGIMGKSGSGKSTLLKLLMRFFPVSEGSITISEKEIGDVNTSNLRDLESYVTQDTHMFHDSIANNIKIAKPDATMEEIEAACKKASVHDFIMSLPNGYEQAVGELGDTLSGGEKQRIGLARAFLHDAPFVLLDEPTSNLDSLNEAVILKSLAEEREGKTVVLVSHRESTMRVADRVYSIENGRMS